MPKQKTRNTAAKRVKKTANGKFVRRHANRGHLRRKKSSTRKRRLRHEELVKKGDRKRFEVSMPY